MKGRINECVDECVNKWALWDQPSHNEFPALRTAFPEQTPDHRDVGEDVALLLLGVMTVLRLHYPSAPCRSHALDLLHLLLILVY